MGNNIKQTPFISGEGKLLLKRMLQSSSAGCVLCQQCKLKGLFVLNCVCRELKNNTVDCKSHHFQLNHHLS